MGVRFWLVVGEDPNNPFSAAEEIYNLSSFHLTLRRKSKSQFVQNA